MRAVPQDVYDVAYDILNARLALSYRALAEGFTIDDVLVELLTTVPAPGARVRVGRIRRPRRRRRIGPTPRYPAPAADAGTGHGRQHALGRVRADAADRPAGRSAGREVTSAPGAGLDLPARLRRIELAVGHKVFGRRDGRHASLVLGHGVEPGEARPYEPGDDVRRMDWSILARTGEPHVRDAIQERDLDVAVLVDRSGSLDFGTVGWRKADLAVNVASAVSGLAVLGGDRIGAVVATAGGPRIVPIRGGRRHLTGLVGSVARSPLGGQVDLGRAIDGLRRVLRRGGLAIVVSDFIAPIETWSPALARLGRRKRGHRRRGHRPARAPTARCRPARDRGSRDRPPADDRHERRALPRPPGRGRRSSAAPRDRPRSGEPGPPTCDCARTRSGPVRSRPASTDAVAPERWVGTRRPIPRPELPDDPVRA